MSHTTEKVFTVSNYNLAATLTSGQAFRWQQRGDEWIGVIGRRWVRLSSQAHELPAAKGNGATNGSIAYNPAAQIIAQTAEPVTDWSWLNHYLQMELDLTEVLASFPTDPAMRSAIVACEGLRLLRQDPWECLASFILSSTKQIVQIQQIISLLCERFGEPLAVPEGFAPGRAFPSAERLALASEIELRDCKMGFRAPYLLETARSITSGEFDLQRLHTLTAFEAREQLLKLPGVGPKIADCVLLFAYGFQNAFPVDVWVMKALRQLYFPRRRPSPTRLHRFTQTYFGRNAGYAQQYLFHYMRTQRRATPLKHE